MTPFGWKCLAIWIALAISTIFDTGQAPSQSVHPPGHWLNHNAYRDPVTLEMCCYFQHSAASLNHCHAMDYRPERLSSGDWKLRDGTIVPKDRVQWSRDYNFYECRHDDGHLLCFFAVPDGS